MRCWSPACEASIVEPGAAATVAAGGSRFRTVLPISAVGLSTAFVTAGHINTEPENRASTFLWWAHFSGKCAEVPVCSVIVAVERRDQRGWEGTLANELDMRGVG